MTDVAVDLDTRDPAVAVDATDLSDPVEPADGTEVRRRDVRKSRLMRLALAVAVVAGLWLVYYVIDVRNFVRTDNAYVNAEMAQVTPLTSGAVVEVLVKDTQAVRRGDVLVRIDPSNAQIAVAQAEAELADARRLFQHSTATGLSLSAQVSARNADIQQARARLASAGADYEKARIDLQRRAALAASGAVSGEELTSARQSHAAANAALAHAQASVRQAQATRKAAEGQLAANDALVLGSTEDTAPGVLVAKAKLAAATLDLQRAVIRAPIDGIVTRRQVQVGQRLSQGQTIMTIVPLAKMYVDANFKERQLDRVRVGMPATVTADLYGGRVTYRGRVVGIAGGTGASMALLPAQNATGNWIKVVQRLPVRIELDPRDLAAHPLRVGLSTEAEIDLSAD